MADFEKDIRVDLEEVEYSHYYDSDNKNSQVYFVRMGLPGVWYFYQNQGYLVIYFVL